MAGPSIFMGGSCDPCCGSVECFSNNSLLSSDYIDVADWQCLVNTTTRVSSKDDVLTEILDSSGDVTSSDNIDGEFVDADPVVEDTVDQVQKAGHFFYTDTDISVTPVTVDNGDGTSTRTTTTTTTVTEVEVVRRLSALVNVSSLWTPEARDIYGGKIAHNLRWHWKSTAVKDDKDEGTRWNPTGARVFSMSSYGRDQGYEDPREWPLELDRHPTDSSEFDSEMSYRLDAVPSEHHGEPTPAGGPYTHYGCSPDICDGKITDWSWSGTTFYSSTWALIGSPTLEFSGGTGVGACGTHNPDESPIPAWVEGTGSGYTAGDQLQYHFPYSEFGGQGEDRTVTVSRVMEPVHSGKVVLLWGPVSGSAGDMDDYYGVEVDDLYVEATPNIIEINELYHEFRQPYDPLKPDMMSVSKTWDRTDRNTWVSNFTVDSSELHLCLSQKGLFNGIYREGESVRVHLIQG